MKTIKKESIFSKPEMNSLSVGVLRISPILKVETITYAMLQVLPYQIGEGIEGKINMDLADWFHIVNILSRHHN